MTKRAINITPEMEDKIVSVIESVSEKISWAIVIESIHKVLRQRYTEQGLRKRQRIADAYQVKRLFLARKKSFRGSIRSQDATAKKIVELELKVERLERENNKLVAKFAVWSFNAAANHITEVELNAPIVND